MEMKKTHILIDSLYGRQIKQENCHGEGSIFFYSKYIGEFLAIYNLCYNY